MEEEGLLESVGETGRHHEAQLDGVSSMHSVEPRRAPAARFFSDGEPIPETASSRVPQGLPCAIHWAHGEEPICRAGVRHTAKVRVCRVLGLGTRQTLGFAVCVPFAHGKIKVTARIH